MEQCRDGGQSILELGRRNESTTHDSVNAQPEEANVLRGLEHRLAAAKLQPQHC